MLKVLSPLKVATGILSGVNYPSLSYTFVVFHQILQNLDQFLRTHLVSSHHHLASALKSFVLQRKDDLKKHNGTISYLSMCVDPKFKLAYVDGDVEREKSQSDLLEYIMQSYPTSIPCTPKPKQRKKRAQDILLHDFLPFVGTTEGPNETLEEEVAGWFSTPTVFLNNDDDVFSWWTANATHFRRIALAAKDLLAISGDSVPSERAFSAAGRLVIPFRTSLSHDTIKAHVCLSSWYQEDDEAVDDNNEELNSSDSSYEIVEEYDEEDV